MSTSPVTDLRETLSATACEVLEIAAFAFADPAGPDQHCLLEEGYLAELRLGGDLCGVLSIAASKELCAALSADTVGLEPDEMSPQQASDMLGELSNIIAGQLATGLMGETAIVHLDPPVRRMLDAAHWQALCQRSSSVLLLIDDHPLLVDLHLDAETAPAVAPLLEFRT